VILKLLDNILFFARTEQGSFIPCRKELTGGRYHVDGDLVLATANEADRHLDLFCPILDACSDHLILILSPLARYLSAVTTPLTVLPVTSRCH
jgi:hypothetical protein